ncbi:MAG: phosphate--acyl-ACP acyltransferase, partial [Bacteroidota bacterium]|nr:phosphate--acyl-ACP acyltransferase [Bacteroidota bacterium]
MGGDFAPLEAIKGVELYLEKINTDTTLLLIGDE